RRRPTRNKKRHRELLALLVGKDQEFTQVRRRLAKLGCVLAEHRAEIAEHLARIDVLDIPARHQHGGIALDERGGSERQIVIGLHFERKFQEIKVLVLKGMSQFMREKHLVQVAGEYEVLECIQG